MLRSGRTLILTCFPSQTQVPSLVNSVKESGLLLGLFGNSAKSLPYVDAWTPEEGVLIAKPQENDYL